MSANKIARVIDQIVIIANWVGAGALFAMMLLTGIDVALRKLVNRPILGSVEITEYLMTIAVGLTIAYCAMQRGHINVDIITHRLSKRAQAIVNAVSSIVFLHLFALITWQTTLKGLNTLANGVTSQSLYIPMAPFAFLVAAGSAALCLVLIKDAVYYIHEATKR